MASIKSGHLPLMSTNTQYNSTFGTFVERNLPVPVNANLEKTLHLLTDPHSTHLKDRHIKVLQRICREYSDGFYLRDLVTLSGIMDNLSTRIDDEPDYVSPLVQIIMLCGKSFLKDRCSDDITFEKSFLSFLKGIVKLVTLQNSMIQIAVTHAIGNLYCTPVPIYDDSGPQACLHEYNIKTIEESNIICYFVEEINKMDMCAVYQEILHLILFLSLSSSNCDNILKLGLIEGLTTSMQNACFSTERKVLQLGVEVLWNVVEYGNIKLVRANFTSELTITSLTNTLAYFVKNSRTLNDNQLRNDIMSVIHVIILKVPKAPILEAGLVKVIALIATQSELKHSDDLVSSLQMKPKQEDFEFKKLVWTSLIQVCPNDAIRETILGYGLMETLFSYVKPNDSVASVAWTSAQYEEIQLQALSSLEALVPHSLDEYMLNHGNTRLLLLLEWSYNGPAFAGHGNSFYSEGGHGNKIAQLRYTIRVLLAVVRCKDEAVTEDLCDQGLIESLLLVLKQHKGMEVMIELGILSNILLILSIICENDVHRKEIFGEEGIRLLLEFLSSTQSRLMSHLGYQKLLLSTVNAIWCCVSQLHHSYFLEYGGIPILLDLLDRCSPSMQNLVLGAILDLSEDPRSVAHIKTWRGAGQKTVASLLIQLWVSEEEVLGVRRGENNVISDVINPISSHDQLITSSTPNALSSAPSMAILDVSDNMRCKIFSLFNRIGMSDIPNLTPKEKVTLIIIENYLDFKVGEVWQEIMAEIAIDKIVPIQSDKDGLDKIRIILEAKAEAVKQRQLEILEAENQEELEAERRSYDQIRSNFLQWELQDAARTEYLNKTSDYESLQLSKQKKDAIREKSKTFQDTDVGLEHETLIRMLTTTVHSGRHVAVSLMDRPRSISSPHKVLPAIPKTDIADKMEYTGSQYEGDTDNGRVEGEGVYIFPSGTKYKGSFKDGAFHGPGTLHFKNGSTFSAIWKEGIPEGDTPSGGKYKFKDGLEFEEEDWNYCDGYDRRFYTEILNGLKPAGRTQKVDKEPAPPIPKGWYDCGDGVYNPEKRIVYSYSDHQFIRNADTNEHKWIVTTCRRGSDFFVGKVYKAPTP